MKKNYLRYYLGRYNGARLRMNKIPFEYKHHVRYETAERDMIFYAQQVAIELNFLREKAKKNKFRKITIQLCA